jgi:hypothetical protein
LRREAILTGAGARTRSARRDGHGRRGRRALPAAPALRLLLVMAVLFLGGAMAAAAAGYKVKQPISDGVLNMRGGPGLNYGIVVAIPQGSVGVHLDGCRPSEDNGRTTSQWCHVTWSGYSGWVSSCCILPDPDAAPPAVPAQAAPDTGFSCLDGALRALPGACGVSNQGDAARRECTEESNDVGIAASVAKSIQTCLQNCVAGGYLARVNCPDVDKVIDYTTYDRPFKFSPGIHQTIETEMMLGGGRRMSCIINFFEYDPPGGTVLFPADGIYGNGRYGKETAILDHEIARQTCTFR